MINQEKLSPIFEPQQVIHFIGLMKVAEIRAHLNERQEFPAQPSEAFTKCVGEFGVLQNITLQRFERPGDDWYSFIIRHGKRRFLAAEKTGLEEIPVIIIESDDITGASLTLIENLHRSSNPIAEYNALMEIERRCSDPLTDKQLSDRLGIKIGKIQKLRRIGSGLPSVLHDAIMAGKLAISNASKLANKSDHVISKVAEFAQENPGDKITQRVIDEILSVETTEATQELFDFIGDQFEPPSLETIETRVRNILELADADQVVTELVKLIQSAMSSGTI